MAQRNLRIEDDLKRQIETVSRTRGYRSSSAFMIEAIEEKLGRIEATASMSEAEKRLTTDLSRITRHVNGNPQFSTGAICPNGYPYQVHSHLYRRATARPVSFGKGKRET